MTLRQYPVIAFSGKAGVGKSWAAAETLARLERAGVPAARYSIATPLKAVFSRAMPDLRLEDKNSDPRVRQALQRLGAAMRETFATPPCTTELRRALAADGEALIIDDLRFPDEYYEVLAGAHSEVIRIQGSGHLTGPEALHESEQFDPPGATEVPDSTTAALVATAAVSRWAAGRRQPWDYAPEAALEALRDGLVVGVSAAYGTGAVEARALLSLIGAREGALAGPDLSALKDKARRAYNSGASALGPLYWMLEYMDDEG